MGSFSLLHPYAVNASSLSSCPSSTTYFARASKMFPKIRAMERGKHCWGAQVRQQRRQWIASLQKSVYWSNELPVLHIDSKLRKLRAMGSKTIPMEQTLDSNGDKG